MAEEEDPVDGVVIIIEEVDMAVEDDQEDGVCFVYIYM